MKLKCNKCNNVDDIVSVRIRYKEINGDVEIQYFHKKTDQRLECSNCKSNDLKDISKFEGIGNFKRIHSLSRDEKAKYLKKRASDHTAKMRKRGEL